MGISKCLPTRALLIVDVQNDFCPGGALAVRDGDRIIPALNKYIRWFHRRKYPIFASRDWHPKRTKHFKIFGGLWPVHCLRKTKGARFHPGLKFPRAMIVLSKGYKTNQDGYSAFEGVSANGKSLPRLLQEKGIKELYVGGLATDYCVQASALDAVRFGLKVNLLIDAIQGVNLRKNDSKKAIQKMVKAGIQKVTRSRLKNL